MHTQKSEDFNIKIQLMNWFYDDELTSTQKQELTNYIHRDLSNMSELTDADIDIAFNDFEKISTNIEGYEIRDNIIRDIGYTISDAYEYVLINVNNKSTLEMN